LASFTPRRYTRAVGEASSRSSSRIAATCENDSSISTAGMTGAPGK
jgi:hypothetical protein